MEQPPPYQTANLAMHEKQNNFQQPPLLVPPVYVSSAPIIVGEYPMQCTCPQCRLQIVTRTEKKNGLLTWLICGCLLIFGFWPCCLIPFCVDGCKDTEQYCPSCGALIGVNKKL